jgi:hypothetical protein
VSTHTTCRTRSWRPGFATALVAALRGTPDVRAQPSAPDAGAKPGPFSSPLRAAPLVAAVVGKYGESQRSRAKQSVQQVLAFWRPGPNVGAGLHLPEP